MEDALADDTPSPEDVGRQTWQRYHLEGTLIPTLLEGDDGGVTGITLKQRKAEAEEQLAVEGVFVYVAGQLPITDFCQASGLRFNEEGNHESGIWVDEEMATSEPGVYAIGDIRNTPYKQVVVAAADGCIAAMAIDKYLKGRKTVRVDWVHS